MLSPNTIRYAMISTQTTGGPTVNQLGVTITPYSPFLQENKRCGMSAGFFLWRWPFTVRTSHCLRANYRTMAAIGVGMETCWCNPSCFSTLSFPAAIMGYPSGQRGGGLVSLWYVWLCLKFSCTTLMWIRSLTAWYPLTAARLVRKYVDSACLVVKILSNPF